MRPLAIVGEEAVAPDALPAALLVVAAADWAGSLGGEPLLRTDPGRATHAMRSGHRWRILSLHPPRHRGVQIWPGCGARPFLLLSCPCRVPSGLLALRGYTLRRISSRRLSTSAFCASLSASSAALSASCSTVSANGLRVATAKPENRNTS